MNISRQRGAVLFIALIMLLVLTVLAVSSMRGVALESRIAGNRAYTERALHLADASLREAEFRFSAAWEHRDGILEPNDDNTHCKKSNTLNRYGNNPPCVLEEINDRDDLAGFFARPLTWLANSDYSNKTGEDTLNLDADSSAVVAWMPYRGLDGDKPFVSDVERAYWHMYCADPCFGSGVGDEYGKVQRGQGMYYFLSNGQVNDEIAVQSMTSLYFLN